MGAAGGIRLTQLGGGLFRARDHIRADLGFFGLPIHLDIPVRGFIDTRQVLVRCCRDSARGGIGREGGGGGGDGPIPRRGEAGMQDSSLVPFALQELYGRWKQEGTEASVAFNPVHERVSVSLAFNV